MYNINQDYGHNLRKGKTYTTQYMFLIMRSQVYIQKYMWIQHNIYKEEQERINNK